MRKKVNGIITIPASLKTNFFRYWLEFLRPFHKLTPKEMDVLAVFLKERYDLSKSVSDDILLDKVCLGSEVKGIVKEQCGITTSHLQIILNKLKKANVIIGERLNPKFIPKNIKEGDTSFELLLHFDFNEGDS